MAAKVNSRTIHLGVIGCGIAASELHWPALQRIPHYFRISAVCNHTEPKARDFARIAGGVPYYLECADLLKQDPVEAVLIGLPIELNYRVDKGCTSGRKACHG